MMDMALGAEYLQPLFKACTDFQIEIGRNLAKLEVDAFWVGDDFGSQTDLLFSVKMFEDLLQPHYERLIKGIKDLQFCTN